MSQETTVEEKLTNILHEFQREFNAKDAFFNDVPPLERKAIKNKYAEIIKDILAAERAAELQAHTDRVVEAIPGKISAENLHIWYLEAVKELHPESFNPNANKPYSELTEEQRFIDKYIRDKVVDTSIQIVKNLKI